MRHLETVGLTVGVVATMFGLSSFGQPARSADGTRPVEPGSTSSSVESPLRNRRVFVLSLQKVKLGMTRTQVRELLGPPDDVWAGEEVNASRIGMVYRPGKEAWAYGGNGHLTFPTLGKVSFGASGKVVAVLGQSGRQSIHALPPEPETQRILRLIDRLKGYDQSNGPLRVIQVVNALQPLGKAGALAVIDEYLRVAEPYGIYGGRDGLFVVARCLFEVRTPPGYFPAMLVGAASPAPGNPRNSPRFPVVLFRDIPFVGINGYALGGAAESVDSHLEPYRNSGIIRSQPLRPPDNPLLVIDDLIASTEWPNWGEKQAWGKSIAWEQALRLVDSVYRVEESEFDHRLTGYYTKQEPQWVTHLRSFAALNAHWDPMRNTYVYPNGTFLPSREEPARVPHTWVASLPSGKAEVTLQRRHRSSVDISMSARGAKPPMPLLRIFVSDKEVKPGWDQHIPSQGGSMSGFRAPEGSDIRLVLERGGKTIAETTLRP